MMFSLCSTNVLWMNKSGFSARRLTAKWNVKRGRPLVRMRCETGNETLFHISVWTFSFSALDFHLYPRGPSCRHLFLPFLLLWCILFSLCYRPLRSSHELCHRYFLPCLPAFCRSVFSTSSIVRYRNLPVNCLHPFHFPPCFVLL